MWNSLFDQIQQRLDDAADLLGDEEGEECEEENVSQQKSSILGVAPVSSSSVPPASEFCVVPSPEVACVEDDAQGWEEEDYDDLLSSAAAASPPSVPAVAPESSSPPATASPSAPAQNHETPSSTEEPPGDTHVPNSEPDTLVDTSDSLRLNLREASEAAVVDAAAAQLATPSAPPLAEEPTALTSSDAVEEPIPSALPPFESTNAVVTASPDPPRELEGSSSAADLPDSLAALHVRDAAEQLPPPSQPVLEEMEATTTPPAPAQRTSNESGELAQLLRFQNQLAEEMESVAALQSENAELKGRVSVLESELASASARLANAAGSEEQICMLIEKLGKEKERHKAAANDRSLLEEHVQDLEEELEEYRVKEESWVGGSEQQRQNESAAQLRIAQLEKEVRARDSLTDDLNAKLRDTMHQKGVLQHQVEDLKASYSTQLLTVKETNSDTVDQLRREVEQLRSSLQNLSAEYDTRTTELEREVVQANARAYQAEARFSEVEFGSVNTLQELRNELEDSRRSITTWKTEAQKARGEYSELLDQYAALKRSRATAETDLRARLAAETATTTELRKELREGEERYQALQGTLRAAHSESEDHKKTIMILEAANQKLKTATADNLNRSYSDASLGSPAVARGSSLDLSLSASPFSSRPAGRAAMAGVPMNPFANRERPSWSDSTDRKTRERLEQEVLRQSAELDRLRQVVGEGAEWKSKFLHLQTEYDLLLQLYGQLEDDMSVLKSGGVAAPAAPHTITTTPLATASSSASP